MSTALGRLERLLTMIPWLLEHPGASVDDLARRFGGTRDEILADLDTLGYCGLPGYGGGDLIEVRLLGDRVSVHMADYFRRPLRLSVREATTLLLAARALAPLVDDGASDALASAVGKLERLLGSDRDRVPALALELAEEAGEQLDVLRRAVAEQRAVRLVYRSESKAEVTERVVEPWRLTVADGAWYLQAWCRLADGQRDFRLDRIREATLTDETVTPPAAPPRPPRYEPADGDPEVLLDVAAGHAWVDEAVVVAERERRGDVDRLRLRAATLDWAARLVLRLAGDAEVVAPPELDARVRSLAGATLARYEHHERTAD